MSHSLPGNNLFYLPEDNLAPEAYERIISPFFAWSHIEDEYDFDDAHDDGFGLVGMHEKPAYRSPNLPRVHDLREKSRLKDMVMCGEVVMLSTLPGPAGLFYIDDNGALICTHKGAFELSGADGVIREYQRSVARRDYRSRGGKPRPTVRERRRPVPEPEPYIPAARKKTVAEPAPKKREITLTLGVFFDGTGNNAVNTQNMMKAYTAGHYDLNDPEAESILAKCARENFGVSGSGAISYTGYYTNIHWLSTLYKQDIPVDKGIVQSAVYIDGIGTDAGKPDSKLGQVFGISDTGVVAKTDNAVARLNDVLNQSIRDIKRQVTDSELVIKSLQFDIFGFSRGAAAARHFANRIQSEDPAIISTIRQGMADITFNGSPSGKTRFIGIFDTVAAIGTPVNGLNPHSADTGDVKLTLRPGVAEKVFHITAENECRFNFALNSVKPAWPELSLPGVHSDIGGGYLPVTKEDLFLTRPATETVPYSQPGEKTQAYQQAVAQLQTLDKSPSLAPLLRTNEISAETWYDDRLPPDRYGQMQKRNFAALTMRGRTVRNDWSRVALRVMLEAAREAGVVFDPIRATNHELHLPDELSSLCDKALTMGKAVRSGQMPQAFSQNELDVIAEKYIHCSANWNAIVVNTDGFIQGGASPSELIGFINRPDEQWKRSVYSMDGKKV